MLMMRLQRVGRKNDPAYRIVVTDKRTGPKSDKHVDRLGSYNPKLGQITLDADKAKDWLAKGVQPSGTVHNILIDQKILKGDKINVLPKKTPIVKEEAVVEEVPKETPSEDMTEETVETPEEKNEEVAAQEEEVSEEKKEA